MLRSRWTLLVAAALVVALESGWTAGGYMLLVISFVLGLVFCVRNLDRPGMAIIVVGAALNALVCTVDHGMPSRGPAFAGNARHHVAGSGDRLLVLSDTIPVRPLHAIVSVGDLILVGGILVAVVARKRHPQSGDTGDGAT